MGGISSTALKDNNAFCVVGTFIITKSSFDYLFANTRDEKDSVVSRLIIGAMLFEGGKYLNNK
jgi:hypothetical protein